MKFPIRIDTIWRGPLLTQGVTPGNSYVTLTDDGVHFRCGPLFNRTVPYSQIANVFPRSWPALYGIGLRSNLRGVIGLIGSYHDVVEVRLTKRIRNWILLFPCDRISVSLEDPERFVEELARRIGLDAEPVETLARPRRKPQQPKPAARTNAAQAETTAASIGRGPSPDTTAGGQPETTVDSEPPIATAAATPGAPENSSRPKQARSRPPKTSQPSRPAQPKGERRKSSPPATNGQSSERPSATTPAKASTRSKRANATTRASRSAASPSSPRSQRRRP
jgi:hypothetical protein